MLLNTNEISFCFETRVHIQLECSLTKDECENGPNCTTSQRQMSSTASEKLDVSLSIEYHTKVLAGNKENILGTVHSNASLHLPNTLLISGLVSSSTLISNGLQLSSEYSTGKNILILQLCHDASTVIPTRV